MPRKCLRQVVTLQTRQKKNEFGDLENNFNNMVENMAVLIKGVEEKSGVIVDASAKIAGVSKSTTETVGQVSEAIQSVAVGAFCIA